ncbi:hypothetical protein P3L10_005351 [Capsicum annuum]
MKLLPSNLRGMKIEDAWTHEDTGSYLTPRFKKLKSINRSSHDAENPFCWL